MNIRSKSTDDTAQLAAAWIARYSWTKIVARGREHFPLLLSGFIAEDDGKIVGALTFERLGDEIEVVTLDSFIEDRGVATALLDAVLALARSEAKQRLCLVTSNDNIRAIRFYQRRGWNMCAFYPNAIDAARKIKPEIPLLGDHDLPIRHEIEFELILDESFK